MAEVDVMRLTLVFLVLALAGATEAQDARSARLKDVARVAGVRENPLTGYGLVFGLSGSGDSARNRATLQSVANTLRGFGVNVEQADLASRNVAAVLVTAKLPAFAEPGQLLDVQVASAGDARSLNGGTLMLAPMMGPDGKVYAIAQGPISVGGYQFEAITASVQKNHPTVGWIPAGATVERAVPLGVAGDGNSLSILLNEPDFTTAQRIASALAAEVPGARVHATHAGKVTVDYGSAPASLVAEIARIENVMVSPQRKSRVVVNERTGTVVAGGDVRLGAVSISHGELRIEISTTYSVSQPDGVFIRPSASIGSVVVPDSRVDVREGVAPIVSVPEGATVADLISALRAIHLSTRDVIAVLQSIKAAGALDGELLIQ
ncbi:MAG TPA: flagellar basal body P-ring protein FlgI [Arenimonas sp.]|uniref:flagellar basal body P-ring protein FlgI n=1 Tax=Arenimonas sp. TaxID=1872635 RepID=UPI002D7F56F2|nr:flagellar basal body P-ring protein FlgI [Arenimonas sp.]HEU0153490.1 flagellar basal body P-ring protein FlgI [Arenimonas sp.]